MKKSAFLIVSFFLLLIICSGLITMKLIRFDLRKLQKENKLQLVNRKFVPTNDSLKSAVKLDESKGEGLAWLIGETFSEGTIEVDLKGNDKFQKSFIGIAFHGINDTIYDAIYFRPFNFLSKNSIRKIHAVQYISHPDFTWKKLRDQHNGRFEKAVNPTPDPNNWFHAKIEVKGRDVRVYVNESEIPSLTVSKLNSRPGGQIAIWVGDGSGGEFSNLSIEKN